MGVGRGRYRIVYLGAALGSGVSDGRFVTVEAAAKTNTASAPYCVANEVLCGELGRFLGLPVPPGGVVYSPSGNHQLFYASLSFNLVGNALPPVNTTKCVKVLPELAAGLLLFDILIANADRHGKNFSVDYSVKPPMMNVFDHGHALFGKDAGQGVVRLERLRDRLAISAGSRTQGNRHCILDQLDTDAHFGRWLDRIRSVPDFVVEDLCEELPGLGCTDKEAAAAEDFLKHRRSNLEHIVEANRNQFTGIQSWSLFR
jgi:hypothetical protein